MGIRCHQTGGVGYYTGDFSSLDITDFSLSFWIKDVGGTSSYGRIWDCHYQYGFAVFRNSTADTLGLYYHQAGGGPLMTAAGLGSGAWTNFVFTRTSSSGAQVLYKNGTSIDTDTGLTGNYENLGTFGIGANNSTSPDGEPWDGGIAEVALWNSVLSSGGVKHASKGI